MEKNHIRTQSTLALNNTIKELPLETRPPLASSAF